MRTSSFYYFKTKPVEIKSKYERWRGVAELLKFSPKERLRVEWIIFYYTQVNQNACLTVKHFDISKKDSFYEMVWSVQAKP